MDALRLFKSLNREQRNTFLACFLGWSLDAFDFFLLTFVIVPMAHDFGTTIADLGYAITLTLALRPVGAFIFGFVQMGIFYTGIDTDWFKLFMGAMMVIAVLFNSYVRNRAMRSR